MFTLAIESILGAATGYVTNDIALRQLFREGGIVEKERDAFTAMLIDMLQEELLQEEALAEIAEDPAVVGFFDDLLAKLLREILPSLLEQDEGNLTSALAQGIQLFRDRLAALEMEDLYFDLEDIEQLLEGAFEGDLFDLLAKQSLAELGLEEILRQGFQELTAWPLQEQLPPKSQVLFRELTLPFFKSLLTHANAPESRRILFDSFVRQQEQNSELEDLILASGRALFHRDELVLKSLPLFTEKFKGALQGLLTKLMPVLVESLVPHRHELVERILRSLEAGTQSIPLLLRSPILSMAERRLDADGPLFQELLADLQGEELALALSRQLLADFSRKIQELLIAAAATDDPGKPFLTAWQTLPEELRRALEARFRDFLAGPALTPAKNDQHLLRLQGGSLELINFFLYERAWAQKLDRRLTAAANRPLKELLAEDFFRDLSKFAQRPLPSSLLADSPLRIDAELLRQLLDRSFERIQKGSIRELYEEIFRALQGKGQEDRLEKNLADAIARQVLLGMPAFLGRLTQEQLDALSQKDIRELVLNLLGHEMKPLSYLGAVVGGLAGFATGSVFVLTGYSPDPRSGAEAAALFAGRSALYGSVGYGTNVLAVRGLFRPYKKTMGWQGLLPKNQERFSESMVEMAESYILNDEIWQSFGHGAKARWQNRRLSLAERFLTEERAQTLALASAEIWPYISTRSLLALAQRQADTLPLDQLLRRGLLRLPWPKMGARILETDFFMRPEGLSLSLPLAPLLSSAKFQKGLYHLLNKGSHRVLFPASEKNAALGERLAGYFLDQAGDFLRSRQGMISSRIADLIFAELSSFEQLAFALADGERYIARALADFIDKELDAFIDWHRHELLTDMGQQFAQGFEGQALVDMGWDCSYEDFLELLFVIREQLHLDLQLAGDAPILCAWRALLKDGRAAAQKSDSHSLQMALEDSLEEIHWSKKDLRALLESCASLLEESEWGQKILDQAAISYLTPESQGSLEGSLQHLLQLSQEELSGSITEAFLVFGDAVFPSVVDYILDDGAAWVSLFNLPKIVADRVDSLDPAELEQLTRKIANPYFQHVERMGWLGAFVALPATALATLIS